MGTRLTLIGSSNPQSVVHLHSLTPKPSWLWRLAPFSTKYCTVSSWPFLAAQCRGVYWWEKQTKLIMVHHECPVRYLMDFLNNGMQWVLGWWIFFRILLHNFRDGHGHFALVNTANMDLLCSYHGGGVWLICVSLWINSLSCASGIKLCTSGCPAVVALLCLQVQSKQ